MSISLMGLVLLILATLGLVAYRKFVTRDEDDLVHLGSSSVQASNRQVAMAKTLTQLDMIMKVLITVTVVYAIGLGAMMIYQALQNGPAPS